MTSSPLASPNSLDLTRSATIAPLGRSETDPVAGEKRRRILAAALGVATGAGSILVVKSAATATAAWLGAPALATVAVAGLATMATAGTVDYFTKRAALKKAGQDVAPFSFVDLMKNMVASRSALIAGGMTTLAAVAPATAIMVVGGVVAALGAGMNDYFAKRRALKATGQSVPAFSLREVLRTVNNSKGAKVAFGVSMLTALGFSALGDMITTTPAEAPVAPSPALSSAEVTAEPSLPAADFAAAAAPAPDVAPEANTVAAEAPVPVAQDYIAEYTLQKGDNLWTVASDLLGPDSTAGEVLAKVKEIAALNNIGNPDYVRAGDAIQLPIAGADAAMLERINAELPGLNLSVTGTLEETLIEAKQNYVPEPPAPVPAPTPVLVEPLAAQPSVAPVAVAAPVVAPAAVGSCYVTEAPTNLHFDCHLDPNAIIEPGAGIDFHAAAQGEVPFRVSLSEGSAPMNAQEFLANHAVPEAEEAFRNDRFDPKP